MAQEIEFIADKITIRGPQVDGNFVVSLHVGEYEKEKIAQLIRLQGNVKVSIVEENLTKKV